MRGTAWRQKFKKCGLFKDEVQAIAKAQRGQSRRLQVGHCCRWHWPNGATSVVQVADDRESDQPVSQQEYPMANAAIARIACLCSTRHDHTLMTRGFAWRVKK